MLCVNCQNIRLKELVPLETTHDEEIKKCQLMNLKNAHQHQSNFRSLLISAQNECTLCMLMSKVLTEKQRCNNYDMVYRSIKGEQEIALVDQLNTEYSGPLYLYAVDGTGRQEDAGIFEIAVVPTFNYGLTDKPTLDPEPDAFYWRGFEVWPQAGKYERFSNLVGYAHRRRITSDPLSIHAVSICQEWLRACRISHPICNSNRRHEMPSRVLDVGPSDHSREPRLHLSLGERGEWATLSHCWGKTVTTILTSALLDNLTQSISYATLPRNFQDAILVTRHLGIRYLWIDSLCIIQDSVEDWLRESAKMGDIYKNSLITIAATNAENSAAGFLKSRTAEVQCSFQTENQARLPVYVRPRIEWYCFSEIIGPLTRRAWVLQERMLARRILHFGAQQMMWQCQSQTLAEGFLDTDQVVEGQVPEEIESMLRTEVHADIEPRSNEELNLSNQDVPQNFQAQVESYCMRNNIFDQWYCVIGIFGCLSLTNPTDKLPAIAGIARQVQLRTGDVYLSGLWRSDIERGLQWSYHPASILVKPHHSRAPTWSWAAPDVRADASIEYFSGSVNLNATGVSRYCAYEHSVLLLNFSSHFISDNCLGNTTGSITLSGLWIEARFSTNSPFDPEAERFGLSYPKPLLLQGHSIIRAAGRLDGHEDDIDVNSMGCLQLGKFEYMGRNYPPENFISALLLQRVSNPIHGSIQFIRIGLAVLFKSCDPIQGWEKKAIEVV